jgi:hypothetical protein
MESMVSNQGVDGWFYMSGTPQAQARKGIQADVPTLFI